jgi:hypothetical protein
VGEYGDVTGCPLTRRRKRRAATVVEGYDRAAVERGDSSIPADDLVVHKCTFALLDVIEQWFPKSREEIVEFGVSETVKMTEAELALNRLLRARNLTRVDLGAWAPKRTRDAINKFELDFERAVMSWYKISWPLRAVYDDLASAEAGLAKDRLDDTFAKLDLFFEAATPAVLEAVSRTTSSGADRDRWSVVMVVDQCRQIWIEQMCEEPPVVAQPQMRWSDFLADVFEAMQLDATPERATKAWKAKRAHIEAACLEKATSTKKYI